MLLSRGIVLVQFCCNEQPSGHYLTFIFKKKSDSLMLVSLLQIRRLKQHLLVQLPPLRRQIVRLLLKSSDIVSAKAAVAEKKVVNRDTDASGKSVAEDMTSEIFIENDGNLYIFLCVYSAKVYVKESCLITDWIKKQGQEELV